MGQGSHTFLEVYIDNFMNADQRNNIKTSTSVVLYTGSTTLKYSREVYLLSNLPSCLESGVGNFYTPAVSNLNIFVNAHRH